MGTPATATTTSGDAAITWSVVKSDKKTLEVTYSIQNTGSERLYVCDQILARIKADQHRATPGTTIRLNDQDPTQARIIVTAPSVGVAPNPTSFAAIEPGATYTGTRRLGWPLQGYTPAGKEMPLPGSVTAAVFEIASFRGEPGSWKDIGNEAGGTFRVPVGFELAMLKADPLPLP